MPCSRYANISGGLYVLRSTQMHREVGGETNRNDSIESISANTPLADVGAIPILIKANIVSSLKRLYLRSICRRIEGLIAERRDRVHAKVGICKDHLLDAVEPCPGMFIVTSVRRDTCSCFGVRSNRAQPFARETYRSRPWMQAKLACKLRDRRWDGEGS